MLIKRLRKMLLIPSRLEFLLLTQTYLESCLHVAMCQTVNTISLTEGCAMKACSLPCVHYAEGLTSTERAKEP